MPFADVSKSQTKFHKAEYLDLSSGMAKIRILNSSAIKTYTHYLGGYTVGCLGEECPICSNNQIIIQTHPDDFRTVHGYNPRTRRYFVNVLDKSNARTCPQCGAEVKIASLVQCPKCQTNIATVPNQPLNKVKILAKGVTLFEQLNNIENAILYPDNHPELAGSPVGLTKFDITILQSGSGRSTTFTVIPEVRADGIYSEISVDPAQLYDLEKATVLLTPAEMLDLQRGVSIKDIFVARKSADFLDEESGATEVKTDAQVRSQLDEIFSNNE